MKCIVIIVLLTLVLLCPAAVALQAFSGETISVDTAVADDIIAGGNIVSINAPVDSVIAAGGTVNINAPVKGDVIAAAGQVYVNADVGGKVVAAGGNVNLGGNIGTNLVAAGGQVNVLANKTVQRDALISGGLVVNAGRVNGALTVRASQFNNTGSAGKVNFHRFEDQGPKKEELETGFSLFGLLALLGYLILGLILVKHLPGIFLAVDGEVRRSTLLRTLMGFVLIIASFIAVLFVAITVVGLPIALISTLFILAALMLSETFISFSLGKWIGERTGKRQSDPVYFVIGFVILNVLLLVPFVGALIKLIAVSLGFCSILYAARGLTQAGGAKEA
jgi:hypothetical protein